MFTLFFGNRVFEIEFPYDFLVIGLRFWANIEANHDSSNWYGIRMYNDTNYYWMNNVAANCEPTENAYSKWYQVNQEIPNIANYQSYCYTDVLMYIDPALDSSSLVSLKY